MATVVGRDAIAVTQAIGGVCFVAPELDRIGGYELATLALARSMRQRGIAVSIVTTTRGPVSRKREDDIIRIEVRGRRTLLHIFPKLFSILIRERAHYSIIQCAAFDYLSGLAVLMGRILRRPVVLRVATENDVRRFAEPQDWKSGLFFCVLRAAAAVIAPSEAIRSELLRAGFSNKKLFLLPNGVDVTRFRPATTTEKTETKTILNLRPDTLVIGTVARLVRRKGIETLLRAFQILRRGQTAHLLVIGDGPLGDDLRALARNLEIDHSVLWLGFQTNPEHWLRAMDVFVFPSRLEGMPNAILEAMATGLPIVASAIGGVVDLLHEGVTGILTPPDDPVVLATALERVVLDQSLRVGLGSRARDRAVEVFSHENIVTRLIELYFRATDHRLR